MRARKYNKKIELWETSQDTFDSFGDPVPNEKILGSLWCQLITTEKPYRTTEFGVIDTTDTITIKLRKRSDFDFNSKNQYFIYRSKIYVMQTEPVNVDFEDREVVITLKKADLNGVTETPPFGNQNQNQNGQN